MFLRKLKYLMYGDCKFIPSCYRINYSRSSDKWLLYFSEICHLGILNLLRDKREEKKFFVETLLAEKNGKSFFFGQSECSL
jgi:hypothetical protein